MPYSWDDLYREQTALKEEIANLQLQYVQESVEEMRHPHYERYSDVLRLAIEERQARLVKVERQLPCELFLKRFGAEFHEVYRAKHPINKDTVLREVETDYRDIAYRIPEAQKVSEPIPPTLIVGQGVAHFETWVDPRATAFGKELWRIGLAWAPEINTVFIQKPGWQKDWS